MIKQSKILFSLILFFQFFSFFHCDATQISFLTVSGKIISLDCQANTTVAEVKKELVPKLQDSPAAEQLVFMVNGKELPNDTLLKKDAKINLIIKFESTIYILAYIAEKGRTTIGITQSFDMKTVQDLKQKIQSTVKTTMGIDIPTEKQRLIFQGKVMPNESFLEEYPFYKEHGPTLVIEKDENIEEKSKPTTSTEKPVEPGDSHLTDQLGVLHKSLLYLKQKLIALSDRLINIKNMLSGKFDVQPDNSASIDKKISLITKNLNDIQNNHIIFTSDIASVIFCDIIINCSSYARNNELKKLMHDVAFHVLHENDSVINQNEEKNYNYIATFIECLKALKNCDVIKDKDLEDKVKRTLEGNDGVNKKFNDFLREVINPKAT